MKINKAISHNIGIKLLALVLAFLTWLYVGEATKVNTEKTVLQKLLSHTIYASQRLRVVPVFSGSVPEGYRLVERDVLVSPESIVMVGPGKLLAQKEEISTEPIDLEEHTKSKTVEVGLESIARSVKLQKVTVQVFLPIEKISAD
jgi:YbbR domain-containing protein